MYIKNEKLMHNSLIEYLFSIHMNLFHAVMTRSECLEWLEVTPSVPVLNAVLPRIYLRRNMNTTFMENTLTDYWGSKKDRKLKMCTNKPEMWFRS